MKLEFEAKKVEYSEAVGGEYVQVLFDSEVYPNPDEDESIYLMVGAQYEFSPINATVEWYDGKEYGGGSEIKEHILTDNTLLLILENEMTFKINFKTDKKTLGEVKNILSIDSKNIKFL